MKYLALIFFLSFAHFWGQTHEPIYTATGYYKAIALKEKQQRKRLYLNSDFTSLLLNIDKSILNLNSPIIIFSIGSECPMSQRSLAKIQSFIDENPKIQFMLLPINFDKNEWIRFVKRHFRKGSVYPITIEKSRMLIEKLLVQTTTENFLFDRQMRLKFRGPIDDSITLLNKEKIANQFYLKNSLENLLAGKKVDIEVVTSPGCAVRKASDDNFQNIVSLDLLERALPLIKSKCLICHRNEKSSSFSLSSINQWEKHRDMILFTIENDYMPPWMPDPHTGPWQNDLRLSKDEKEVLLQFFSSRLSREPEVEKKISQILKVNQYSSLEKFDFEFKSYDILIPAQGTMDYNYQIFKISNNQDKWIKGIRYDTNAWKNLHHITVFVMSPEWKGLKKDGLTKITNLLTTYLPGRQLYNWPKGSAIKVPAGSQLLVTSHFSTLGQPVEANYKIGIYFEEADKVQKPIHFLRVANDSFSIPANQSHYQITASVVLDEDINVVSVFPHLHKRGTRYSVFVDSKNEKRSELLFSTHRFDFYNQGVFFYAKPVHLRKGDVIRAIAEYDNSSENLLNPNPSLRVKEGTSVDDEMMAFAIRFTK